MIEFIHIENFKTLLEADFPLASLNIFSGLNGMGKSSLIQCLLLLRQSHDNNTLISKGLLLNGNYVELGMGDDVLSENNTTDEIQILLKWKAYAKGKEFFFNVEPESDLLPFSNKKGSTILRDTYTQSLFTSQFQYLSADRISPKSHYALSDYHIKDLHSLGNQGEYTVHYIAANDTKDLAIAALKHHSAKTATLLDNIQCWMSEITPDIKIRANTQKQFNASTLSYYFAQGKDITADMKPQNVGFGLTYALPVITAILKSKPNDLLIIENPESHLHPAGQAMVGRLCCLAAANGVQVIIESHSDHFLNGVRVGVKHKLIENDQVKLFFLERPSDSSEHASVVHSPSIDKLGKIDNWPDGFFDEWDKQLDNLI